MLADEEGIMKRICFFGDSITVAGLWIAEVFENVKKDEVKLYNCGVAGDTALRSLNRLYATCLSYNPDAVVVMFGMNDVGRWLYEESNNEPEERKSEHIKLFEKSMREIADKIIGAGIELILCTTSPFDDITPFDGEKTTVNDGLAKCAEVTRKLAAERNCKCIDFFKEMYEILKKDRIVKEDRVHQTELGQHYMAKIFMREMGINAHTDNFVLDGINKERYKLEQDLRHIDFVEWNLMLEERLKRKMTHAEKIGFAKKKLSEAKEADDKTNISWYGVYLDTVEDKEDIRAKLTELTLNM